MGDVCVHGVSGCGVARGLFVTKGDSLGSVCMYMYARKTYMRRCCHIISDKISGARTRLYHNVMINTSTMCLHWLMHLLAKVLALLYSANVRTSAYSA